MFSLSITSSAASYLASQEAWVFFTFASMAAVVTYVFVMVLGYVEYPIFHRQKSFDSDADADNDDKDDKEEQERKANEKLIKTLINSKAESDILEGETSTYKWRQSGYEIDVFIPLREGSDSVSTSDIVVDIKRKHLSISYQRVPLLSGELYDEVIPEESTWQVETSSRLDRNSSHLWVTIYKAKPTSVLQHWDCLIKGESATLRGEIRRERRRSISLGVDPFDNKASKLVSSPN